MRLAEVQRRVLHDTQRNVRVVRDTRDWHAWNTARARLYRDTLHTLLDHDLPDDARQLIVAALEAER